MDILEKHGKKLHIKKTHLEWADRWFERHGDATVFFTRMLPIIRTFISLPAGVARMPFWRFSVFTVPGCIPWVLMLTFIGKQAGDNWEDWKDNLHYFDYAVAAAIVLGVLYLLAARGAAGEEPETEPGSTPETGASERRPVGAASGSRCPTRSRWACSRAGRAPAGLELRSHRPRSAPAGLARPEACASRSRWPCTPARRRCLRWPLRAGRTSTCAGSALTLAPAAVTGLLFEARSRSGSDPHARWRSPRSPRER